MSLDQFTETIIASSSTSINSYQHVLCNVAKSYPCGMRYTDDEIAEIRRINLLKLRKEMGLSFAEIARRTGTNDQYLSQIANKRIQKGGKRPRSMSSDYAGKIETGLGLPPGWLDTAHLSADSPTSQTEIAPAEQRGAGAGIDSTGILQVTPQQRKVIIELLDMVDGDAEKLSRLVDMYKTFKEMEGGAP